MEEPARKLEWDFKELIGNLEHYSGSPDHILSPECILMDAYKGIVELLSIVETDANLKDIMNKLEPTTDLLHGIYEAVMDKRNRQSGATLPTRKNEEMNQ